MSRELAKTYDPKGIEDSLYEKWIEKKYFHAKADRSRKPFTIVMPPPNITGSRECRATMRCGSRARIMRA